MVEEPVAFEQAGAVARIRFNRPEVLNALDIASGKALLKICQKLERDREVRVVVISGAGRAFMAGGDVAEFGGEPAARTTRIEGLIADLHASIEILTGLRSPVVASVHGAVAGAGISIMLAADLAIASDDCVLNLAYAKIGASPDGSASWSLPRMVGVRKALEIAMLSDNVGADEALRLGLVNRVVSRSALAAETEALVDRLAHGPTSAYGRIKHLMRTSHERSLSGQLEAERQSFLECSRTSDFSSAVAAFLQKKRADFSGK